MTDACPVCGEAQTPSDVRCQSCGAQLDALLVDLAGPPAPDEPVIQAPRRTKEVLTVVAVVLGLAVGAGFLFSSGGEPDPISLAAPAGNTEAPVAATPQPFPTPEPFPRPTVAATPAPTPTPETTEEVSLADLAPLLGEVSGLSLAWRDGGAVHVLDLDTGSERQVAIEGASVDAQIAAMTDRVVIRFGNRLHVVEPDGEVRELTIAGGVDQILAAPADRGVWVVRYARSAQDAPQVAFLDDDSLVAETDPAWRDLPRFAYPSGVTSRGLIVGLWQGRPFLFGPDGTFEQLPYDGVLASAADHLVTYSCEGGIELRCPTSLVDLETRSVVEVAVDASQPWEWRLAPGGRHLYWMDWSTNPAGHFVVDLATGVVDEIGSGSSSRVTQDTMRFSPDGEWLVGVWLETVLFHRVADRTAIELPVDTGRLEGSHELVVFSTAEPA